MLQEAPISTEQVKHSRGSNGRVRREGLHHLGGDETARRVSHARNGTEHSKEGDRAQEHAVGCHTGGCAHDCMERKLAIGAVMGLSAQVA